MMTDKEIDELLKGMRAIKRELEIISTLMCIALGIAMGQLWIVPIVGALLE